MNTDEVVDLFWSARPEWSEQDTITHYSGKGRMYPTDVRVAFCDFIDNLRRDRPISGTLAQEVSLSR